MRVAVGGIWHETNTFAAHHTPLAGFEVQEGDALVDALRGTRTPIGGFLDGARERRFEIVPTLFAPAVPSGTVERAAYEDLSGRLVAQLAGARPDAVLLDHHGAMVVEGIEDVEGDLLGRVRARLGAVPIGVVFDFHANIAAGFVDHVDVFAGYDTYPHVDPYDRGVEVAGLLARLAAGEIRPVRARLQPPLVTIPQAQKTDAPPMREIMALAHDLEKRPKILSVTVAGGFAYADVPHAGLSVVATADGDLELARGAAREVARAAWEARERFRVENVPPAEAVARALREPEGPVILVDVADNIGGGSPGDGTVLLAELLKARARGAVVSMADPEVAARAREGETLEATVGGKVDRMHGPPVAVRARVVRVGCGDFAYGGSYMTRKKVDAGRAAVLDADGVTIVVREKKVMPFDRAELETLGIDPRACRIIVAKSAIAWRAAYGDLARRSIDVDTPGICTARLETLPYRRLRRPVAPLDREADFPQND